ncbi:MAG: hypothetical protein ABI190_12320 [Casimicrobiaceae bacterium]
MRFFSPAGRAAFADETDAGLAIMEAEYPSASAIGPFFRHYAAILADRRENAGRVADALALVRWTLDTVTEPGVGVYVPELHRLRGVCLLRLNASHETEAMRSLQTALDVAKQQGATLLQLRAAISIAKASRALKRANAGLETLRDVCAELPPECDVPEIEEAKRLLAE